MARFRFLHAADIHLDSPLHGLSRYEGVPIEQIRAASRAAFDALVRFAVDEAVDFVIIAGDLFDGDWKDMSTGLYFARAMGVLDRASIPVFLLAGNHDAASSLTRTLRPPANVRVFNTARPSSFALDEIGVVLHGQGFATASVEANLARAYPAAVPNAFNIGVLHTSLGGHPAHATYAPCSEAELTAKGYDYWALGHVHAFARLGEAVPIVFPGNLQGRTIRETGPKGAVLVDVQDGTLALRHVTLDVVRWARVEVDCAGAGSLDEVLDRARSALSAVHAAEADGRPMVARVELRGATPLAGALLDRQTRLRDEVRALAAAVSPELWLEKLSNRTTRPPAPSAAPDLSDDVHALLREAADSAELRAMLARELAGFLAATPSPQAGGEGGLGEAARSGDWAPLLAAAAQALPARLAQSGEG
jgi:DNA repair exonuclease SbcCD nuclease subunit